MDDCMRPSGRWEECEKEGTAPIDGHRHQHITARCWLEAEEEKRVCLLSLSLPPSVPRAMCSCLETRLQQVTSTDAGGFDGRWSAGGRAILQGGSVVEEWVTDSELRGVSTSMDIWEVEWRAGGPTQSPPRGRRLARMALAFVAWLERGGDEELQLQVTLCILVLRPAACESTAEILGTAGSIGTDRSRLTILRESVSQPTSS
ncbi:hypothetical protein PDE_03598 [Penicillium oxalicum 114-2]|uniref:Uncharacterized protein n=1 Tax=Penicillium oxalicum (strain 114-2 / CGMCC 5302) TaxID=933388 RepID=S8B2J7_PENO1|nr:hypothetical protein PDE_03598 [Penicillium oxalicum 114-2]